MQIEHAFEEDTQRARQPGEPVEQAADSSLFFVDQVCLCFSSHRAVLGNKGGKVLACRLATLQQPWPHPRQQRHPSQSGRPGS